MKTSNSYLIFISLVSAMGGFLFGYDWVVIGGAKPFYEVYFGISNSLTAQGWAMGSAILGCLIGVMISGSLSDRFGRKSLMSVTALIFIVAAIGTGAANVFVLFIVFRILGGIGVGIASNLSPMYIAEVSPGNTRGKYVSINQLTIVLGILAAQTVNWLIAEPVAAGENILDSWNGLFGWRWMFWAQIVPAGLFFILLFFIPESPRWLVVRAMRAGALRATPLQKANNIFARIGGKEYATKEIEQIKLSVTHTIRHCERGTSEAIPSQLTEDCFVPRNDGKIVKASPEGRFGGASFRDLFRGKTGKIIIIAIVIAVFQQWCGINVIFNYAQEIFSAAGYGVSDILMNIVITGIINVIFTFVGMYTVDKLGRRALLLFGAAGLFCIYAILGACYYFHISGIAVLILVVAAIACYAMTLAPVTWVVLSEIFPNRIRAMAMAVSTFALWTACFVLTYTFPLLNNAFGAYGTFWLYGIICIAGFIFIKKYLFETKGKTLEEIEKIV